MLHKEYAGAQWWKFDFHTHTPASKDFKPDGNNEVTPEYWLKKFIDEGIDCVAITDHNSGAWIDKLKQANQTLEQPLHLFPAVEISANGGVHLLAIFDTEKTKGDIDSLLGAVGYEGTKGDSDGVTEKSITEVIDIITQRGGIAIPAHTDKEKGLFFNSDSNTLKQVLKNPNIHAIELCDSNYQKPQLYIDEKIQWSEVLGSDTHNFQSKKFGNFTWIKMDTPNIAGLKLALIDGKASIKNMSAKPNKHADYIIESMSIKNAKYIGKPNALECKFSPFLNTIIGGRGSGKSTLLEFMRFSLRRNKAIPDAIKDDKYFQVGGDNLLTNESELSLIYKKGGTRYQLNWSADGSAKSLKVEEDEQWQTENGEISTLFPVQIYSQKQIFELSKNSEALLDIIDKDEQVKFTDFDNNKKQLTYQYKQIKQQINQTQEKIAQKNKLTGELNDLTRQIKQIEKSGHKTVLQNYRKHQRQLNTIERIEKEWQENTDLLADMTNSIAPSDFEEGIFLEQDEMLQALQSSNNKWQNITQQIRNITQEAKQISTDWQQEKSQAPWTQTLQSEINNYEQIKTQLEQQGIDPEKYPFLLQQQTQKQKDLTQIEDYEATLNNLENELGSVFVKIKKNRAELTNNRQVFLRGVLQNNQAVKIAVEPFKEDIKSVEKSISEILQCKDRFRKDIDYLMENYTDADTLKQSIEIIFQDEIKAKDKRFYEHLHNLPQESLLDLKLWFPKDNLKITFGNNQAIETGSAGQKCAALLAFILSYGNDPLLLDQPEDDLDNELIYDLIVKQIRATKNKRQIIIVTHNANIVVNGDAEMVLPMSVGGGQSYINESASIQNKAIREKICTVLEGGQQAFNLRYKRIHLEE